MPHIDAQDYLRLCEEAGTLYFLDIEATGLRGDYNSVLCVSFKPYGKKPFTLRVSQVGNDQKVVREAAEVIADEADIIAGYYSKGFDIPMLNTRLLKWGHDPIPKTHHLDMYYTLKANLLTARRSQGHLLSWLETPESKMTVGADIWSGMNLNFEKNMSIMVKRCESDVAGLEALYERTKHLIREIKR